MQEQNAEKVVSLSIKATKMTANLLKSVINEYLKQQKNKQPKVYKGKQSVKHLVQNSKDKLVNVEITDKNIGLFNRTARKYGIDYSLKKDTSATPPKYLIFFKAKDTDVLTAAFNEFMKKSIEKSKKPSIRARIKTLSRQIAVKAQELKREKNKTREAER